MTNHRGVKSNSDSLEPLGLCRAPESEKWGGLNSSILIAIIVALYLMRGVTSY